MQNKKERPVILKPFNKKKIDELLQDWDKNKNKMLGYKLKKFPKLTECLDGIQKGLYIFAGVTGLGNTSLLISLFLDIFKSNNNIFCIYITLKDTEDDIYYKMLSCNTHKAEINDLKKMGYFKIIGDKKTYENCDKSFNDFDLYTGKIALYGKETISSFDILEKAIEHHKKENQDKQVVVFLDPLNDVQMPSLGNSDLNIKNKIQKLRNLANIKKIPLITTLEFFPKYNLDKAYNVANEKGFSDAEFFAFLAESEIEKIKYIENSPKTIKLKLIIKKNKFNQKKLINIDLKFDLCYAHIKEI